MRFLSLLKQRGYRSSSIQCVPVRSRKCSSDTGEAKLFGTLHHPRVTLATCFDGADVRAGRLCLREWEFVCPGFVQTFCKRRDVLAGGVRNLNANRRARC